MGKRTNNNKEAGKFWDVICILKENKSGKYLVKWDGIDPTTKKPWVPSWVPKEDVTEDLIESWEEQKASVNKPRPKPGHKKSISSNTTNTGRYSLRSKTAPSEVKPYRNLARLSSTRSSVLYGLAPPPTKRPATRGSSNNSEAMALDGNGEALRPLKNFKPKSILKHSSESSPLAAQRRVRLSIPGRKGEDDVANTGCPAHE